MSSLTNYIIAMVIVTNCIIIHAAPTCHWEYEGETGPFNWGTICAATYSKCLDGVRQSPIDISGYTTEVHDESEATSMGINLKFPANGYPANLFWNNHTITIAPSSSNLVNVPYIMIQGKKHTVLQSHFHIPAEHYIDGEAYDGVIHFVTNSTDGLGFAVVAVLFEAAAGAINHPLLSTVANNIVALATTSESNPIPITMQWSPQRFDTASYFKLDGSLTTPPCTEGIRWHIYQQRDKVPAAQLATLNSLMKNNVRPLQSKKGRSIVLHQFGNQSSSKSLSDAQLALIIAIPVGVTLMVIVGFLFYRIGASSSDAKSNKKEQEINMANKKEQVTTETHKPENPVQSV